MGVKVTVTCKQEALDKLKSIGCLPAALSCISFVAFGVPTILAIVAITIIIMVIAVPMFIGLVTAALIKTTYQAMMKKTVKVKHSDMDETTSFAYDLFDPMCDDEQK